MKLKKYTFNGHTYSARRWSELTGIPNDSLRKRLSRSRNCEKKIADALTSGCSESFLRFINPSFIKPTEQEKVECTKPKPTINGHEIESFTGSSRVGEITLVYRDDLIAIQRDQDRTMKLYCNGIKVAAKPALKELLYCYGITVQNMNAKNTQALGAILFKHVKVPALTL